MTSHSLKHTRILTDLRARSRRRGGREGKFHSNFHAAERRTGQAFSIAKAAAAATRRQQCHVTPLHKQPEYRSAKLLASIRYANRSTDRPTDGSTDRAIDGLKKTQMKLYRTLRILQMVDCHGSIDNEVSRRYAQNTTSDTISSSEQLRSIGSTTTRR